MRIANEERTFYLSGEGIDECSEFIDGLLEKMDIERRNRVRTRLLLEDSLLELVEHFGEGFPITVYVRRRLNSVTVRMVYLGEAFNPLVETGDESTAIQSSLLSNMSVRPIYGRSGNRNSLRVTFRNVRYSPSVALLLSILVGIIFGQVGSYLMPDYFQRELTSVVFSPLLNTVGNILNVLAAPVVCLMVLTAVLDARSIEQHGGNRFMLTVRYFLLSVLLSSVAVIIALIAFGISVGVDKLDYDLIKVIMGGVDTVIPTNVISPFISSNTPQILMISFVVANAIIFLGEDVAGLTELIHEANMVSMLITNWVGNLVPLFTAMLLTLEIWDGTIDILLAMWRPLLLAVSVSVGVIAVSLIIMGVRFKVSPLKLLRKMWKPFYLTLVSGTLDTSYGEAEHSCIYELGISEEYTKVTLPQGLVLYMPASFMGTLIFIIFTSVAHGVDITVLWLIEAVLLDVLLFVATPPVPGANLLAFIAIFATLGISKSAFLDAMIFDIIFGLFANAANQLLLQSEMIRQARSLGMLNEEKLRA